MKALPRDLTATEQIIELKFKLRKLSALLGVISSDIGTDKVIAIARKGDYPRNDDEIRAMCDPKILTKSEKAHLRFIYDRMMIIYQEQPSSDYMKKLKSIFE